MTNYQLIVSVICTVLAILGGLIGYLNYRDKKAEEARKDGQENGVVYTELGYIKRGIDEIRADNKEWNAKRDTQYTELCVAVRSADDKASSAHKRIDGIEKVLSK